MECFRCGSAIVRTEKSTHVDFRCRRCPAQWSQRKERSAHAHQLVRAMVYDHHAQLGQCPNCVHPLHEGDCPD